MLTLPKCELCARYKDDGKHETCEAFPDGIPEDTSTPEEKEAAWQEFVARAKEKGIWRED